MKLEQNAQAPLFSNTQIPDIFFSEYLSSANGDYIKIYLYICSIIKRSLNNIQNSRKITTILHYYRQ